MRNTLIAAAAAGLIGLISALPASAAPLDRIAPSHSEATLIMKHGHGHGHRGGWHRGGRGHHYGWHRGRGHHYGWHRGHGHRHHWR